MFSFQQSVVLFFARFWSVTGRSSRSEFWWGFLLYLILTFLIELASKVLAPIFGSIIVNASFVIYLVIVCSMMCLTARRLHDRGLNGLWCLLYLIPLLGVLILAFIALKPSFAFSNRFGIDPTSDVIGHYNFYAKRHFVRHGAYFGQTIHDYQGYQGDPNFTHHHHNQGGAGTDPFAGGFGESPFKEHFRNNQQQAPNNGASSGRRNNNGNM